MQPSRIIKKRIYEIVKRAWFSKWRQVECRERTGKSKDAIWINKTAKWVGKYKVLERAKWAKRT